jgi:hypothetical protein
MFIGGAIISILGGIGWYTRKPVRDGYAAGYDSVEAAISPFVTALGLAVVVASVLDWIGVW